MVRGERMRSDVFLQQKCGMLWRLWNWMNEVGGRV